MDSQAVLDYWEGLDLVTRVMEKNTGNQRFSFFDGPVTANNPLGVHHAWGRTYKDVVQRYKALRGYDQRFQNGFDCQGLWVEVEVEKSLGLESKRHVIDFGLDRFSDECRRRVDTYSEIQTEQSRRLGQMMDWANSYYTHSDRNVEHIWHFLKVCHERGWLYRGSRPMPWCWRCGTSLSAHEQADSYREMTHTAVYALLPVEGGYLLVWTTTPWTLPANVAVAVHPDLEYAEYRLGDKSLYAGAWLAGTGLLGGAELLRRFPGKELEGMVYSLPLDNPLHGYTRRVVLWEEVQQGEGTGLVHVAPGCGAEDHSLALHLGLPVQPALDGSGHYLDGYGKYSGMFYTEVGVSVLADLGEHLLRSEEYAHRYSVCWRCKEELVYRLVDEWFMSCEQVRPLLFEASESVTWDPPHLKTQFQDWLRNMGDWCISRKRFWGLPLPFYLCSCGHLNVVGSVEEFRKRCGSVPVELHRPWVDGYEVECESCGRAVRRVEEVGDCWLDAGVMPFSTLNYLGDREHWERWFPADFVCEMREQTRLWFYASMFISVTLTGRAPFRYVLGYEKVMDKEGRPLHKTGRNVIWLDDVLDLGADELRLLYLSQSRSRSMRFDPDNLREYRRLLNQFRSTLNFFRTYADLDGFRFRDGYLSSPELLDRWVLTRLDQFVEEMRTLYDSYSFVELVSEFRTFLDDLSNWYVRRSRRRFWGHGDSEQKLYAENVLYHCLRTLSVVVAPIVPFLSESVYQALRQYGDGLDSVHLEQFPQPRNREDDLLDLMEITRQLARQGKALRQSLGLRVRRPLLELLLHVNGLRPRLYEFVPLLQDELNVTRVRFIDSVDWYVHIGLKPRYREVGRLLGNLVPELRKVLKQMSQSEVKEYVFGGRSMELEVGGTVLPVTEETFEVEYRWRGGYAGSVSPLGFVLFNLQPSVMLENLGKFRDLVRSVQVERKRLGLRVSEPVRLVLKFGDSSFRRFVEERSEELKMEVSADRLVMEDDLGESGKVCLVTKEVTFFLEPSG